MKKIVYILVSLLIVILIGISFGISFYNDKLLNDKHNDIKDEVISYLKDKYKEDFDIVEFSYEKNTYNAEEDGEIVTKEFNSSYVYNFIMASNRLVEFDVTYIVYEDEDEYISNKKYDIMMPGIYDNYIYEYKIKSIKSDIKNDVFDIVSDSWDLNIYMDYFDEDKLLINYSLDDSEVKEKYDKYRKLDKSISNEEWFLSCLEINTSYALTLEIEVNKYIDNNNLDDFKEEVKELVRYLEEKGYVEYDINFSFKNYTSARATKYLDNDLDQIYLIFAYVENYSDVLDEDKLKAYILDK